MILDSSVYKNRIEYKVNRYKKTYIEYVLLLFLKTIILRLIFENIKNTILMFS